MDSIKAISVVLLSLVSLNVFAMSDSDVTAKAAKDIQDAIIKSTTGDGCKDVHFLNVNKFEDLLAVNQVASIQPLFGGGTSVGGYDSYAETYEGAIVVPAAEAYVTSANKLDAKPVSQVFGIKLVISRGDCSETKTTGELSLYSSKSDKFVVVSKFKIKD